MAIRLLGPVTATAGGQGLAIGGPKPRATLSVLALAAPRACSMDHLVDALWGESPTASARNAIQVNVTGLRKALGPHGVTIERVGDGYRLGGDFSVDAHHFDELVAQGRAALRVGDAPRSVESLTAALGLWEGQPYQGVDAAAFVDAARQHLDATRGAALTDLAHAQLRTGDPRGAAATATDLLADHPYDESAWSALATAHYLAGQQDQALETCRKARAVLVDELGVDPTAGLAELESQILNHALPDPRKPASEPLPASSPLPLPSLPDPHVARDDVVAEVRTRLEEGQRLVTLVGMGGLGRPLLPQRWPTTLPGRGNESPSPASPPTTTRWRPCVACAGTWASRVTTTPSRPSPVRAGVGCSSWTTASRSPDSVPPSTTSCGSALTCPSWPRAEGPSARCTSMPAPSRHSAPPMPRSSSSGTLSESGRGSGGTTQLRCAASVPCSTAYPWRSSWPPDGSGR